MRQSKNPYYVYALKDPRVSPARPFYIGKGTGTRLLEHGVRPDNSRKGRKIQEIQEEEYEVVRTILVDDLTEQEALKLEAELIAAFGTVETGGILENEILPTGKISRAREGVVVPAGAIEKAQLGLEMVKSAVVELAKANRNGITNADAAKVLGLQSEHKGKQRDYLTYSILGILLRERKIKDKLTPTGKNRTYHTV